MENIRYEITVQVSRGDLLANSDWLVPGKDHMFMLEARPQLRHRVSTACVQSGTTLRICEYDSAIFL